MRARGRRFATTLLGRPLAAVLRWRLRLSARRTGLAVVYHRVDRSRGDPARELLPALDEGRFEAHVRHLKRRYRVVRASELPSAAARRRRGERIPVAVTFDDDLPEHRRTAAPILTRQRAEATFFLCGASLEQPFAFWWERLQRAFDRGLDVTPVFGGRSPGRAVPEMTIHHAAEAIRGLPATARAEVAERLGDLLGPDPDGAGLRAADVRALTAAGFEIGFHTRDHHVLTTLDDAALDAALRSGRSELEALGGGPLELIAYPHGEADARVAAAARTAGYRLGFTTARCAVHPWSDPLLLGRYEPWLAAPGVFALEVARALRSTADA